MTLEVYLAYLATCAVFFLTPPGPSQILMISNSARYGWRGATPTIAGDLSANALQMLAAAFGLAAVIAASQTALLVVKWLGVGYLVYVGLKTFFAAAPEIGEAPAARRSDLFRQGFLTSATNPKAVFFFAALFPQFLTPEAPIWPQLAVLAFTYLAIDGALLVAWGMAAEGAAGRLRASGRWLNRVSGGLMVAAAGLLALKDAEVRR